MQTRLQTSILCVSISIATCVLTAVTPALSQTGSADSSAEPAGTDPKPDKSSYTLFNPTPNTQLRLFSTDRPGKTHSSLTVDAGHFQLEGDFWNYTWDSWTKDGTKTRFNSFLNMNYKLGLTNWAELNIIFPTYNKIQIKTSTQPTTRVRGVGDLFIGGKVNFFGNDEGDQSLGAIGFAKIPTAPLGLGNGKPEYTLNVPFTTVLPQEFSLTVEPAVGLLRNKQNTGYQGDYQFLVNLNRPILGKEVIAALELALDFPDDRPIGARHTLDPSLQWLITPNLQLDLGIYIGLTKAAPDWNPYVGISFRY
ncbi:MAG TPA: transporter [Stellaceae bacterium]|nr:transporter [Stellaceae bacterium]